MRLIDEFVQKVLDETDSFSIILPPEINLIRYYHFIQGRVGKARYVYGTYSHQDKIFQSGLNLAPELVSIVSNNHVYIVNHYFFNLKRYSPGKNTLPDNTSYLDCHKANGYVDDVIFPKFYGALKITENIDKPECRKKAREILLTKRKTIDELHMDDCFDLQDVANFLCGFIHIEDEAEHRLEAKKNYYIGEKSERTKIMEHLEDPSIAENWERKIAEGLQSVDAKAVTVEFEINGKQSSGKLSPGIIIKKLIQNESFHSYDFITSKHGNQVMENLGIEYSYTMDNVLKCSHIKSITYGKRVLYMSQPQESYSKEDA